jgi:hypothetical protein
MPKSEFDTEPALSARQCTVRGARFPAQPAEPAHHHKGVGANFPFPRLGRVKHLQPARPLPCRALTRPQLDQFIAALVEG